MPSRQRTNVVCTAKQCTGHAHAGVTHMRVILVFTLPFFAQAASFSFFGSR